MLPYNVAGFQIKLPPSPPVPRPREPASPSVALFLPIVAHEEPVCHETDPNDFGLFRCYKEWLSIDPGNQLELNKVADAPMFVPHVSKTNTPKNQCKASSNPFYPFINVTIF